MTNLKIRYLVTSPSGDVPVDPDKLDYSLEEDPLKTSYRKYLSAITDFLNKNNGVPFLNAINERLSVDTNIQQLDEIIVRTEKHGALYHPASIEVLAGKNNTKFGLNVAVTDRGKELLRKEFDLLKTLRSRFNLPYLPKPYYMDELHSMIFLLEEWFEGYHEFHISKTKDNKLKTKLWEYGKGDRFLSSGESFEIYRQASMILTLYYDVDTFKLIYPWHHAAGDFVARRESHKMDVRLTTVRGYEPFLPIEEDTVHPALAFFYFLLHLSIQMRLDKLDGIGNSVWADDFSVDATLTGFFQALEQKNDFKDALDSPVTFLKLLKTFSRDELRNTFMPIVEQFEKTKDFKTISENLERHIGRLYLTLQNYLL